MDFDFKSLVERTQTGERDYAARISEKETADSYRELPSLFVKSIDTAKRQIEAIVSDASLDRYDEILLPEAFRETLGLYLQNPVVISSHQHRLETGHSSVVGQVVRAWIDEAGLHVVIQFAETELGNEFWYLYSNKYQRAFSVGFILLEARTENRNNKNIQVLTKVELLEISCVAVPANRNALSKSKQRKADFVANKIAQRQAENAADDFDEEIANFDFEAVGLKRPTEKDGFELADNLAAFENSIIEDDEPDYARIAKSGATSGQELYQE
jgi:HK97 family phage prohead protease